ncbi:hypothetical protein P7M41_26325, partial [Vibrio parahaemolyticus]|nr:hypothetical protein [Vibrio parahaemolyticus]
HREATIMLSNGSLTCCVRNYNNAASIVLNFFNFSKEDKTVFRHKFVVMVSKLKHFSGYLHDNSWPTFEGQYC